MTQKLKTARLKKLREKEELAIQSQVSHRRAAAEATAKAEQCSGYLGRLREEIQELESV